MKQWWEIQSARIDALSLRERAFLFLSVIACCLALADVLWLSPAQVAHKKLKQRFETQSAELGSMRDRLSTNAKPVDAGKAARDEINVVKARLDSVNQTINDLLPHANESTPLAQVLVQLLRRHDGLTLVRTAVVAPELAIAKTAQGLAPGAASGSNELPVGLTRQGVELTVSGSYAGLTRYVQTLENALADVRWGPMTLKSEKQPPELTLQLFLLGVQP